MMKSPKLFPCNFRLMCAVAAIAFLMLNDSLDRRSSASAADVFTLSVIPDMQVPIDTVRSPNQENYHLFTNMTDWIGSNAQSQNIRFVSQVGDIVEHGGIQTEHFLAEMAMARLDTATNASGGTGIPWAVSYGNHEMNDVGLNAKTQQEPQDPASSLSYREFFATNNGTHRYANHVGFGGVSSNDLNTWHTFKASDAPDAREYLLLNLEYDVPGGGEPTFTGGTPMFDAINWAQGIIDAHPDMPTIIQTHVFEGSKSGPPNQPYNLGGAGRNSQLQIFDKLVNNNSQVFMVLSGHVREYTHSFKTNAAGLPVLQMATDFTGSSFEEGGYFRNIQFDEDNSQINVTTYSPTLDQNLTDGQNQFTWNVDWGVRFDGETPPPLPTTTPKLVAHWKLDDGQTNPTTLTAVDSVAPAADGTFVSSADPQPNWVTGKAGGAIDFAGADNVVTMSNDPKLNITGAVTLSAWVRRDGDPQNAVFATIAGKDVNGGPTNDAYWLKHVVATDEVQFGVTSGGVNTTATTIGAGTLEDLTTAALADGGDGFVHLVGVFSPNEAVQMYVNGELVNFSQAAPAAMQLSSAPFQIGQHSNSTQHTFNGAIDDVQVYSSALSGEQILHLFQNPGQHHPDSEFPDPNPDPPTPLASRLVAHWKLDDGQADPNTLVAVDSVSPENHGQLVNFSTPVSNKWVTGKSGGALEFGGNSAANGSDDVVEVNDTSGKLDITGALTISAWIKFDEKGGVNSTRHIAGKDRAGGPTSDGFSLKHQMSSSNDSVEFLIAENGVNTNLVASTSLTDLTNASVTAGNEGWVHVVGVLDPDNFMHLYINGQLDAAYSEAVEGVPSAIDSVPTPFTIGRLHNSTTHSFNGAIDDVQVYAGVLSPEEIQFLFENPGMAIANLPGDVDDDGDVDSDDMGLLLENYGRADADGFADGDFDGDNKVGLSDLLVLKQHFGESILSAPLPTANAVPEPSTWIMLALAVFIVPVFRRRKSA